MPTWVLLAGGFGLLLAGAELLVRGSASLALRAGVPSLLVGLTIVSWGTSSPELMVSLRAALRGNPSIAVGNVVGSNICNIGLILGIAAVIRPLSVKLQLIRRDVPVLIAVSVLLVVIVLDHAISRGEGLVLTAVLVAYTTLAVRQARREPLAVQEAVLEAAPVPLRPRRGIAFDVGAVVVGLAALAIGADVFVQGAVGAARALGVSNAVIALTVVAVGTSLPELATSSVAALRGEGDIAIGNVVGSNIFNVLGILGPTALLHPIVGSEIGLSNVAVALAAAVLLLPLLITGFRLTRWEGALLVGLYVLYVIRLLP
jgi:cation:H+ antiporter